MTFELNIKCFWQHTATSNHLEITKIKWSNLFDPFVITAHSLRQLQAGNWKTPLKPGTEDLTNLFSALQQFLEFPLSKNAHRLTRHLIRLCRYTVREYVFDPVKEAAVDSELIGYAQMVTNFPTFLNSFNRAVGKLFRSNMFLRELLNTCRVTGGLRRGNKKQLKVTQL